LHISKNLNLIKKIVIVTSYDYWRAGILNETNIDGISVGDCSVMLSVTETIATHIRAFKIGAPDKFIIAVMPFLLSTRKGIESAMNSVEKLIRETSQHDKSLNSRLLIN